MKQSAADDISAAYDDVGWIGGFDLNGNLMSTVVAIDEGIFEYLKLERGIENESACRTSVFLPRERCDRTER